ncbi:MAG TPA: NnrS family protein [Candidatus Udaeobacter sp.]|nr:NnrS family protein [Candidatus Udaeobacter sp.]
MSSEGQSLVPDRPGIGEPTAVWVGEPFRIFFPLGLLLGVIGVGLWPLFVWHAIDFYPANAHVRLMIEGLMGSFIIGFLGTAGPRLLDARPLGSLEISGLIVLQLLSVGLHLAQNQAAGDVVFLVLLLIFLGMLGTRASSAQDLPPPHFILVLFAFISAIAGIFLTAAGKSMTNGIFAARLGALMLNEGFVLFPILGVGAFFFPKLLGGAAPGPSDLQIEPVLWAKGAAIAALTALVIWFSFVMEALGWIRTAAVVRGLTTLWYFVVRGRLFKAPSTPPFMAQCFRLGALLLVAGLLLPALLPNYRVANLHLTFIGGFTIILFTVSTRVILGHSGHQHLFQKRLRFLIASLVLLILATLARVSADFVLPERNSHLVYAALIWLVAAIVWAWALGPKLLISADE